MKATLTFDLPEEEAEHKYALAGLDALLLIDNLLNEIRAALKHDAGEFGKLDHDTLEEVRTFIFDQKEARRLPELV